jgi:hypothetical protein
LQKREQLPHGVLGAAALEMDAGKIVVGARLVGLLASRSVGEVTNA